ncbi:hypothetical protein ACIS_00996 [Anaplasma centrale str. Israel]|uniref:Uncharacterized protein n=1 Tax=Anaplasma centrale (strain Israel) TaxID=574556 RepID=D1ASN2_ANACI|nr:PAS-domain containing protein [Anaplasma centrale]ACZ49485.1 hypothetical protein ACIS_00996 [Anaplasma centrale str. Israel]
MFTYAAAYVLVFVLAILVVFCFYTSLSISDFRHNNNLLTSLLLSLGDGFYLWDEKKRVERFSPNLQMLLNSVFCSFNELANFFEESDQLRKNFAEARRINKSFTMDLKGKDAEIYCSCYGQSIVDDQDRVVGVLLWIQNVTGGRSLVASLNHKNTKLARELNNCSSIIDALPYPVWKRNKSAEVEMHNPFYLKLMQNNQGDTLVRQLSSRVAGSETEFQEKAFMIVDNERRLYLLTEMKTADGGSVGYGQDITQSWQLTQEIKGHSKAQKSILGSLPCAAALYGSDGRLLFFNSHFSKFWQLDQSWMRSGATYSEVIQMMHEKGFVDDGSFELLKKQQYELFGKLTEPYHDTLVLQDGTVLEVSVVPNHKQELLFLYSRVKD